MGREILFKGKRKDNREWIEGCYSAIGTRHVIIKAQSDDYYSVDNDVKKGHGNEVVEVSPETVCQYIGLHDNTKWEELSEIEQRKFLSEWNFEKNRQNIKEDWKGRKIFEGDIVKTKFFGKDNGEGQNFNDYDLFEIVYKDGAYILKNSLREFSSRYIADMEGGGICVVGNIFDNPELLESR